MAPAFSKPSIFGFVVSIAASAVLIRKYGDVASGADSRVPKLFVESTNQSKSKEKVAVDGLFLRRVWRLLKIMCPGVITPEFGFAVLVAGMLLSRTYCDLWMIRTSTSIESAIISRNAPEFVSSLSKFILGFVPIALVNNLLKYGLAEMVLRFRRRLTTYLLSQYMRGYTYYQISNTDNRIANPDQLLTQDVDRFANSIVELYSNLSKPLLDIGVYAYKLAFTIGLQGPGTMLGYLAAAGVILTWLRRPIGRSGRMEDYYESARMLINLSGAVGRLVLAGREMTRLAGFTSRVTELIDVLDDLNNGFYERTMVEDKSEPSSPTSTSDPVKRVPSSRSRIRKQIMCGTVTLQDHVIRFTDVPLTTPNGDILVDKLNLEVPAGMNVLICGPNGCGKSSLFRILGGLWPMFGGSIVKPPQDKLFYIPQRPYLTLGSLRDQVIFPHTKQDMERDNVTDDDLLRLLNDVHLGSLVDRPGGWDAIQDWTDVLSGGEKQRVAMARVFYHRPQFAILDECTSAVSVDVEGFMYERCRQLNITLFTVSHRRSLWKYHTNVLQMDGRGAYVFRPITPQDLESGFGS